MSATAPNFEALDPPLEGAPAEDEMREDTGEFGVSGTEEFNRLSAEQTAAEAEARARPGDRVAGIKFENARLRKELFLLEHDNAGVFKFDKFARESERLFTDTGEGMAIAVDPAGTFTLREGERNHRFLTVNMNELDRFNKEGGGHAAGNAALNETAALIEKSLAAFATEKGGVLGYNVFRYSSNEFLVEFPDVSEQDLASLKKSIESQRVSVPWVATEAAPLTVASFGSGEVTDIINVSQLELPVSERAQDGKEAVREYVGTMRSMADFNLEVDKFTGRANRMLELIAREGETVDGKEWNRTDTEAFFKNYLAKMFERTELLTVDSFRALAEKKRKMVEEDKKAAFDANLELLGVLAAHDRFASNRHFAQLERFLIGQRLGSGEMVVTPAVEKPERAEPRRPFSGMLAEIPQFPGELTAIGQLYSEAEAAEAALKEKPDDVTARIEAENKELRYRVESTRHDSGTGLLRRGVYYEELERKLLADEPATTMFIDMGFLKYFDQKGGREVADAALKTAADIMVRAIADAGVKATAFRYAGDEFTILVDGGVVDAEKIRASIEKLNAESGCIPDLAELRERGIGDIPEGRDSAPEYAPTRLSFNIGIADDEMATEVYADLMRAEAFTGEKGLELVNPLNLANLKAELMTKIADTAVARDKAVDRFSMLIEELRSSEYADPEKKKQIESLITFSNKALFAELGGNAALRIFAEEKGLSSEELEAQIRRFAEDRLEFVDKLKDQKRELSDQLVELHAEIGHLNGRLTEAQRENATQDDELKRLRDRLKKAEEERKQLIDIRREIEQKKAA